MSTKQMTCHIPICDDCGEELEYEYVQHFPSEGDAIGHATDCDWLVVEDKLYCEKCRDGKGFGCRSCDDLVKEDGDRCQSCQAEERRRIMPHHDTDGPLPPECPTQRCIYSGSLHPLRPRAERKRAEGGS